MRDKIFVFDMDGVIVDTTKKHYALYIQFINSFGKEADVEECRKLDGLKIAEIIAYAKNEHNLPYSEEELIRRYHQEIEKIYSQVTLIKKVDKVLRTLRKHGCKIALASSAHRKYVDLVLERFKLKDYFDFIVSGDDVSQAKPSPEIYNCVRSYFGNKEYFVIEDSSHGIAAAANARMNVIFFNPDKSEINKINPVKQDGIRLDIKTPAEYSIKEMDEMNSILKEIGGGCKTVALANKIEVILSNEKMLVSDEEQQIVDSYWEEQIAQNALLFNGKMLSYLIHYFDEETLYVKCFVTEYKNFLAQLAGKVDFNIKPLAVSGIILDEENNTLLARRSNKVTEYKNYYEFAPSGGLSKEDVVDDKIQFQERLVKELQEETMLSLSDIRKITPLGIILDRKDNVYDICLKIGIKGNLNRLNQLYQLSQHRSGASLLRSNEYSQLLILSITEVDNFFQQQKVVPTSVSLCNILINQEGNIK